MTTRYEEGLALLDRLDKEQIGPIVDGLKDIAPDFSRLLVEFAFGDIYARPGIDLRSRQIATLAALTVLGAAPQLKAHIRASLAAGLSRPEIIEILMQMALYAGFPAALDALAIAREAFKEARGA
ncbi:MAG: carboxymuconolactone decarboxylase family protein [Alphaproteobacteria bacterium]|nr:carboxymuconolactone decarboxylase family protein [Alphaproteobacteria bacterium]